MFMEEQYGEVGRKMYYGLKLFEQQSIMSTSS